MERISVFDIFKIGVGPSSSHTVGPMKAARQFVLGFANVSGKVTKIQTTLFGSLAYTGKGHGTDKAVIAGLSGFAPETADPKQMLGLMQVVEESNRVSIAGKHEIDFLPKTDLKFSGKVIGEHSNAMRLTSLKADGEVMS